VDPTTQALCDMLGRGDPELRAAAARVLAELAPGERPVLDALGTVLASGAAPAARYALQALAASTSPEAIERLLPALAGPTDLRQPAADAIARLGSAALPYLKTAILHAELPVRTGAATVLARIGSKAAHEALLRALAAGDLALSKHVCVELERAILAMDAKGREALASMVHKYLEHKRVAACETAAASGLILLGFLKVPKSRATLLAFARPKQPPELRHRALVALRGVASELTQADLAALARYIEEDDLANVVVPAIELLRPLPVPAAAAGRLVALVASPHQAVRDFAIYKMGRLDTPEAAKTLVEQLDAPQPGLRDLALASLQRNPAAVPLLLKRLRAEADPARFWTLVRVLEPHAAAIPAAQASALTRTLIEQTEKGDKRADALCYLLRRAAPEPLGGALLKRAVALKEKGAFADADRMLTALVRNGAASAEATYQSAVAALKLSPKGISRHERHADPCLDRIGLLIGQPDFGLAKRLCAEKCLGPGELFYVGFHFAEQLGERREFGGLLLSHVVGLGPRTALAASARNKLRLEAFPPQLWDSAKLSAGEKTARTRSRR